MTVYDNSGGVKVIGFTTQKTVRAPSFRRIYLRQKDNIRSYHIVPPRLGSANDFGSIEIEFNVPVSDAELCQAR